jgi:hypothetical protein
MVLWEAVRAMEIAFKIKRTIALATVLENTL